MSTACAPAAQDPATPQAAVEPAPPNDAAAAPLVAPRRTNGTQAEWAEHLHAALADEDPFAVARALDALGANLAAWRGEGLDARVAEAVQRLAVAEAAPLRRRIDPRRLVPALEVLIDVGDGAALERVTGERDGRAAEPLWSGAASVATRRTAYTGRVVFGGGCALRWNGEPRTAAPASWEAPMGTHSAACGTSAPHVVPVHADLELRLHAVDGALVWEDPSADPLLNPGASP